MVRRVSCGLMKELVGRLIPRRHGQSIMALSFGLPLDRPTRASAWLNDVIRSCGRRFPSSCKSTTWLDSTGFMQP